MRALEKMMKKVEQKKHAADITGVMEKAQIRMNQTRVDYNDTNDSIEHIDFDLRPNHLIASRQNHFERVAISNERVLTVPYGLKVKESKQDRSLEMYSKY